MKPHPMQKTFDAANTFDRAEAAIGRLLEKGRAFVGSTKVVAMVQEMAEDAEVAIEVRNAGGRGWWITLK